MSDVVVVGGGQAGFQVAASLREGGHAGAVTIVTDEPGLPYQRPPLSKAYLDGRADADTLALRAPSWFEAHGVRLLPGRAERIRRAERVLDLADGSSLPYDHLVLATGARNRALPVPGAALDGVVQLRSVADAADLKARLAGVRRAVVVGAGFIGLEFAAVAAARGIAVTVVEAADRPMARALSRETSAFFRRVHEEAGIAFAFGATAARIVERDGRAAGVETGDGRVVAGDLVLVGIGVVPNVDLAVAAQLPVDGGILVDATLATADPAISALGDCAAFPSPHAGGRTIRIESVQNAVDGGKAVAARLLGRPAPHAAVPWFWSDQGPWKLQMAGLSTPHDRVVLRGDPATGAFSCFCFADGALVGVESVNRPADHMVARRLVAGRVPLTPAQAADPAFDLKAAALARPA